MKSRQPAVSQNVVYRRGSSSVTQTFFDDFSDLLERLSTFSAPLMIAGDFNVHVDDATASTLLICLMYCRVTAYANTSPHQLTSTAPPYTGPADNER